MAVLYDAKYPSTAGGMLSCSIDLHIIVLERPLPMELLDQMDLLHNHLTITAGTFLCPTICT